MSERIYFWFFVTLSFVGVIAFGTYSMKSHMRALEQGSMLGSVPVDEVAGALDELKSQTASSIEVLKDFLAQQKNDDLENAVSNTTTEEHVGESELIQNEKDISVSTTKQVATEETTSTATPVNASSVNP